MCIRDRFENLKISQLENLLEALKLDKQQMALSARNKSLSDPGLDFLMGKLDEMPGSGLTPEAHLAKYADIDKDILTLEQMIKNKRMKGRKPHESGGLAYMLGEPNTRIEALQHAGVIADPKGLYTDPSIYSKGESEIPQNYYEGGGVGRGPWTKGIAPGTPEQPCLLYTSPSPRD